MSNSISQAKGRASQAPSKLSIDEDRALSSYIPVSKWVSPFIFGQDGEALSCVTKYLDHRSIAGLKQQGGKLADKQFNGDIDPSEISPATSIIAEAYQQRVGYSMQVTQVAKQTANNMQVEGSPGP